MKLKSLFDRHVLDHQYCLHWRNWRVCQTRSWSQITPSIEEAVRVWAGTRSWSPILSPLNEAEEFDRHPFLITNTPYINEAEEHVWPPPLMKLKILTDTFLIINTPSIEWSWRVWQVRRSWSPIIPPKKKLKSLTDTFLITNTPSINEANEGFERTRSSSPILPPLKKLKSFPDTFFITNYPSVEEAVKFGRHVLITNTLSIDEAEEFDTHVLDHQYSLH